MARGGSRTAARRGRASVPRMVPYAAVVAALAVVISLIVASRGVENRVMDLNNSGVWVTNDTRGLWGRVNRSAGALDAAFTDRERESLTGSVDVFQDGEAVLAWTKDESRLFTVDTRDAVASPDPPVAVAKVSAVAMGGGVLASITADKGEVRCADYVPSTIADVSGLGVDRPAAAVLDVVSGLETGVDIAADSSGRVFAASASGGWALIDQTGAVTYGSVGQTLRSVAVSLAGGIGVITDPVSGDVFLTNGVHAEAGAGVVPQQPGDDGGRVIVATPTGLSAISAGNLTDLYDVASGGTDRVIARPVVTGTVVYGAWGGTPGRVVKIDGSTVQEDIFPQDGSPLVRPAFRVNRGSVVLNDMATGTVFDVDERWAMNDWEDVAPEATELSGESQSSSEDSPKATDDHVWARAGRMAVVHVLDNDENPGTGIVAITAVDGPDASRAAISPDGQTLVVDVPEDQADEMTMRYTISNRAVSSEDTDETSSANVTVSMRPQGENTVPFQSADQGRDETVPDFTVPSSGFVSIAPAGGWRDPDSDLVSVVSASVGDRVLPVTTQGLIQYTAPATPGQITEKVSYLVSDGFGQVVPGTVYIRVMPDSAVQAIPPVAMPDSVRGIAGVPVVFYPLDNDVPGSDPLDKQAQLMLASPVGARVGIQVSTDVLSGAVTVTADRAGAYFLDYIAAFGSGFDAGKIRVDITDDDQVVAMPDTAVIRGTVPVVVDLLSNDRDPLGSVLTVTSAVPQDPDRVRVGIVQGRWLRVDPVSSVPSSTPTVIVYEVTNGRTQATGQVSVTLLPAVSVDHVSVVDDAARVRVGDVTTIAVLDNDSSESGEPLVLNDNVEGMANAGQLRVEDPSAPVGQETTDVGRAFVDGNRVRYEAPTSGDGKRVRIEYQAGVVGGSPMTGYVWVDVVPEPHVADQTDATPAPGGAAVMTGNNVPTPVSVEARVIVGDAVQVPIAVYGQDPDGDSVTVAGLRTPPKYGRVVEYGADYLIYESYPDVGNAGVDSFQFYVQDRFGAIGIGTARIGLSAPHDVPPPLGVEDVVTAQPGVPVTVYPVTNDVVPIGTGETTIVLDDPSAARVDQDSQSVETVAPDEDAPSVALGYHLDAGGVAGTSAQIMVRSQTGYLNPPTVFDHAASDIDNDMASVDVLEDAWDVDGPDAGIHIVSVGGQGSFDGATVSVPVLDRGQMIPYVVEDGDGAQAMAVVFVPSLTDGRPMLRSGGLIRMDRNGTEQVSLNDYIESPRNQPVHLTLSSQVWTSPSSYLDVSVTSDQQMTLRARGDYVGPAALTVEVRDSPDATDPTALTGVVTIPVQIGAATPVLWCPDEILEVVQGGAPVGVDVAEVCHAWMPSQTEIDALSFTGSWDLGGEGITITGRDQGDLPSDLVTLQALPESRPGTDSVLAIGVDGYDVTSQMRVQVIAAPKPTMSVPSVTDVQATTTVEVPVTVTSPMLGAVQNIVSVTPTSPLEADVTFDDRTIRVTPDAQSHGVLTFDVVGSDISDDARTDRQVTSNFSVTVFGVPDPPAVPQPGTALRSRSAVVTFVPGAENGAPILGYEIEWDQGSQSCGLNTTCEIPNLVNGTAYRFRVRAVNKAGESEWSEYGPEVIPNAIPGAVTGFTASNPGCGTLDLSWKPPQGEGTAPTMYHLTWTNQTAPVTVNGADTAYTPTGLDNDQPTTFTIVAENEAGISQRPVTTMGQSSCKPVWPDNALTISHSGMEDTAQMTIRWSKADPQGPGPVVYTVTRTGPGGTTTFAPTTELTLGDNSDEIGYDGQTYTYRVTATNATGGTAHTSDEITGSFQAVNTPAEWSTVGGADAVSIAATGQDGQIQVSVNKFPNFHDSSGHVDVTVGSQTTTLTPGNASATLGGFTNGTDAVASFTACNTQSSTGDVAPCNTAQNVSLAGGSFGGLTAPVISAKPGTGIAVCVTAAGSGNARGATLVVTADNGIGEVYRSPAPSSSDVSVDNLCVDAPTWDTDITFTAHLESVSTIPSRANSPNATYTTHSVVGTPDPWETGAIQAMGTGNNGEVLLTATPFPVSNGGTLRVTYSVAGTSLQGVIPASGSVTVTGLPANGNDYTFTVTADNGTNTSAADPVKAHAYGPLGVPVLTAQPGQGMNACVQASTPESGTNGEMARLRITAGTATVWESALQVGTIDSGTRCFRADDYNTNVTFTAQLVTGPNLVRTDSPTATKQAKSSIGTPAALSTANITANPTGNDGEISISLTGTLPASNGGPDDHLRVRVDGLPEGTVTLEGSSNKALESGFTNGVPTTLTFTPCNAEQCNESGAIQKTITAAGPLGVPILVSGGPVAELSTDKHVCASFSAEANGANATLSVTNNVNSDKNVVSGSGTITVPQLCVLAGGAEAEVVFTATITDTSTLETKRTLQTFAWTGISAKDAGPMGTFGPAAATKVFHDDTLADVCTGFMFNPNGGDMTVTVTRVDQPDDETWDVVKDILVPADGPEEGTKIMICGTVPSDGRTLDFHGVMTDASAFHRESQIASVSVFVEKPPPMTINLVSSGPGSGPIKEACVTFEANGGVNGLNKYHVQLGVSAPEFGKTKYSSSSAVNNPSVDLCVDTGGPSRTVTFTARVLDFSQYHRSDVTTTATVTSASTNVVPDGGATVTGGQGTVTLKGWAIDPDTEWAIAVHVYIGGDSQHGEPHNLDRVMDSCSDLGISVPSTYSQLYSSNHCFNQTLTTSKTGGQDVYIYGLDSDDPAYNHEIAHTTVTIT